MLLFIQLSSHCWVYLKLVPLELLANTEQADREYHDLHLRKYIEIIDNNIQMQYHASNRLIEEQDEQIEEITEIAHRLKTQGNAMNQQLQRQNQIIGQLDNQIDLTTGRLNTVQRKLGQLLETDDAGQICTFVMMAGLCCLFTLCIFIF